MIQQSATPDLMAAINEAAAETLHLAEMPHKGLPTLRNVPADHWLLSCSPFFELRSSMYHHVKKLMFTVRVD
jgi:hypothetical protein